MRGLLLVVGFAFQAYFWQRRKVNHFENRTKHEQGPLGPIIECRLENEKAVKKERRDDI